MALVEEHLRRDVLWGAAERVGTRARLQDLREVEVGELRVTVREEEHVLGLKSTVDDVLLVDVRKRGGGLGAVELRLIVSDHLSPRDALHDDVDVPVVLAVTCHADPEEA